MKRSALILTLTAILLAACGQAGTSAQAGATATEMAQPMILTVFAAASLTDAFTEIGEDFETSHPNVSVVFSFAGSQILRTQIEQGANPDVFASANELEMNTLVSDGLVAANAPQAFVTNRLVIVLPPGNPANVQSLADLARPGLKLVLAASDVPAGDYTRQVLENLNELYGTDFSTRVLANVVSDEENVRLVLTKVQLGEADAGSVYTSDAVAAPDLLTLPILDPYNVVADYPIAAPDSAPSPEMAATFIAYVLSPDGQAVMKKWDFTPVNP
jgi:molybdate transport system substrate-binding protein